MGHVDEREAIMVQVRGWQKAVDDYRATTDRDLADLEADRDKWAARALLAGVSIRSLARTLGMSKSSAQRRLKPVADKMREAA